jgi:hypothetical protein
MSGEKDVTLPVWAEKLVDKTIRLLQNDTLKQKIQLLVLQPFLQYIIELLFPYVVIVCVLFGSMMLILISILIILLYKSGTPVPAASMLVS